jgi:drug/metabolite transporter (DMT)-like permease
VSGSIMCALALLGALAGRGTSDAHAPIHWWALVAAAAAGGLGQIAVTRAFALERAARLGAVSYAGVALTYAAEAALLGRAPGPLQLLGALLIVTAGILTVTARGAEVEGPADGEA